MEKINQKELKQLFNKIKESDRKSAVEELYNRYNTVIYGIAFSILKNKEDSEDVVQNVMIKIYNLDKEKLPTDKETIWLYTVTKNEALGLIRKKNKEIISEDIYEIECENNEIENIIDKESFNKLINSLNDKEKEIVSLKVISNLSFKQIESLLGEPINTIKWRYYNSIYKIKMLLSNFSLFIMTFILGIFTIKNSDKVANQVTQDSANKEDENQENELSSPILDKTETDNIWEDTEKVETNENIIIQETIEQSTSTNYFGIGILSVSVVFLIVTIITLIFFKKYQLKLKVKSSK